LTSIERWGARDWQRRTSLTADTSVESPNAGWHRVSVTPSMTIVRSGLAPVALGGTHDQTTFTSVANGGTFDVDPARWLFPGVSGKDCDIALNGNPTVGWLLLLLGDIDQHLEKVSAKEVKDLQIDILGDTAIAFFVSHSSVKVKARATLYEPTFRVTMIFQRTSAGWRVIHFHESALSTQAAQAMASA
jgi:SnoaL-like domain